MIFCLFLAAILMLTSMNFLSFIIGAVFGVVSVTGLRAAAKADPLMSRVYCRHISYRDYYPNYSRPYRKAKTSGVY